MSSTAIGTFTCWDGYDDYELVEERPSLPPRRPRLPSKSPLPSSGRRGVERSTERPQTSKVQAPREQEYTSLHELWNTLRERKHAAEAKLPLKVKSLEAPQTQAGSSGLLSRSAPEQHVTTPRKVTPPKVKRKKSTYATTLLHLYSILILFNVLKGLRFIPRVSFRSYGTYAPSHPRDHHLLIPAQITATFDLPGIKKDQAHVSFRWNNLVVTWKTVKISEKEEDGRLVREREEKKYTRTIPLPEGTKVSRLLCFHCLSWHRSMGLPV